MCDVVSSNENRRALYRLLPILADAWQRLGSSFLVSDWIHMSRVQKQYGLERMYGNLVEIVDLILGPYSSTNTALSQQFRLSVARIHHYQYDRINVNFNLLWQFWLSGVKAKTSVSSMGKYSTCTVSHRDVQWKEFRKQTDHWRYW